jgi:hypothetical protein
VATTIATTKAEIASALFYYAAGTAIAGDQDRALNLITEARTLDPAHSPAWINELAEIGQHHHGVLQLIPGLTTPSGSTQGISPEEPADDGN